MKNILLVILLLLPDMAVYGKSDVACWDSIQERSRKCIVQVFNDVSTFNYGEPYKEGNTSEARGSGFFIKNKNKDKGLILTNYHVVADSLRIQVQLLSIGKRRLDADVISVAPKSDLALIRLSKDSIELIEEECGEIGWLEFGSSDQMRRGDEVFTLGFPLGQESLKGTQGVISGYQNVFLQQQGFNRFCLQTTAPINNGNSGGPALNKAGQVVGINFAAFAEAQNVGYIIPIDGVKSDLDNMFCSKLVRAQPMGMAVQPMTPSMAKALKCPKRLTGVYVVSVFDRGFTGLLGIKSGDVISEVNGLKVDFQGQVSVDWSDERVDADEVTARVPFGKEIACKVCRDGKIITLKSEKTLGSLLPIRTWFPPYESFDYEVFGGGLVVAPLSLNLVLILCDRKPTLRSYLLNQNQVDGKLVISHVLPTSAASDPRNLFRLGSVIKFVNDKEVTTLQEFRDVIKSALKNEEFITFTTDNGFKEVFESKSVLKDSLRLSKMFLFTKENSISLNMAEQN